MPNTPGDWYAADDGHPPPVEAEAHARLAAAAPDLLAALTALLAAWQAAPDTVRVADGLTAYALWGAAARAVHKATQGD